MKFENQPILNRADQLPEDGWFHIVPLGRFANLLNGHPITQVLDQTAIEAMHNRFKADAKKILIDTEHFSYDADKSTEAAGWITNTEIREDGLWAQIEWTDLGEPAIKNKRYRFISPVWLPEECEKINSAELRPLRLDTCGLTNKPNLKGMTPLSNRSTVTNQEKPRMKQLLTALGLDESADESAALEALNAITNRATAAEAKVLQIETARLDLDADAFCEKHKALIANKEVVKAQFIANRTVTEALFASMATRAPEQSSLKNRCVKQPDSVVVNRRQQQHDKIAAIKNRDKCTHEQAFNVAAAENPALFSETV